MLRKVKPLWIVYGILYALEIGSHFLEDDRITILIIGVIIIITVVRFYVIGFQYEDYMTHKYPDEFLEMCKKREKLSTQCNFSPRIPDPRLVELQAKVKNLISFTIISVTIPAIILIVTNKW